MAFVVPWSALVVAQGGFYAPATLAVGLVLSLVAGAFSFRSPHLSLAAPTLFAVTGGVCCTSAVLQGDATGVPLGCVWVAAGAVALMPSLKGLVDREQALSWLENVGIWGAALGVLMFAGLLPWPGSMNAGRLQFFLQYANAAGILLAALFLATAPLPERAFRAGRPLIVMAAGLTESVGAILCLIGAALGLIALLLVHDRRDAAVAVAGDGLLGGAAACCALAAGPLGGLGGSVLAVGLRRAVGRRSGSAGKGKGGKRGKGMPRAAVLAVGAALVACVLAVAALMIFVPGRLAQAVATFSERLDQIGDAFVLWSASPLIGIGPGAWDGLYQGVQATDYVSSVVHSSWAQLALDGGLLALLPFCSACAVGLAGLVRRGEWGVLAGIAAVLVHGLFDFDLQFGSILYLLAFLLGFGALADGAPSPPSRWAAVGIALLGIAASLTGLVLSL